MRNVELRNGLNTDYIPAAAKALLTTILAYLKISLPFLRAPSHDPCHEAICNSTIRLLRLEEFALVSEVLTTVGLMIDDDGFGSGSSSAISDALSHDAEPERSIGDFGENYYT